MLLKPGEWAVLEALLPPAGDSFPGLRHTGFEAFLDDFRAAAPSHLRRAFGLGLLAGAWVAPLLVRRPPPLRRLAPADRERALAAMAGSSLPELRQLTAVLKTVVSLHYGGLPEVRKAIGHP